MASAVLNDWNFAVLNDWDLASNASSLSATDTRLPSHVAGLLPSPPSVTFAAIDILHDAFTGVVGHLYRLRDLEHLYRHDLEAFIWVFIWVACCIEDGISSRCVEDGTSPRCVEDARRLDPLPELFNDWVLGDVKRCQGGKLRLLHFGFQAVGPTATWAAGPTSTWAAGPPSTWAAEGSLANSLLCYLFRLHNRQAEVVWDVTENATPPEEEDAPEKDWKEFLQVLRKAGQKNPPLIFWSIW